MLFINTDKTYELYDPNVEMFLYVNPFSAKLEHSLIAISKWESHYKKPFLPGGRGKGLTTLDEQLFYIKCMAINNLPENGALVLLTYYSELILDYIGDPQSASTTSTINKPNNSVSSKTITSELIYYWMIDFNIPSEYDKWHINRLLRLIDICNIKRQEYSGKGNKMSAADSAKYRYMLNKQRLAEQ